MVRWAADDESAAAAVQRQRRDLRQRESTRGRKQPAAMAIDLGVERATARGRLVGCRGVKQVEARRNLELCIVVGEGVGVEVVGAHELLKVLHVVHAAQVAPKYLSAGAFGVREIVAVLTLQ